jgi:thiamine biosynthesis protein ThiS
MTITINGQSNSSFPSPISVSELLEKLSLSTLPVLVEVDRTALLPREHSSTLLKEGSVIEIIRVAAGG